MQIMNLNIIKLNKTYHTNENSFTLKKNATAFNKSSQNSYKYIQFYFISFFKIRSSIILNLERKCTKPYT